MEGTQETGGEVMTIELLATFGISFGMFLLLIGLEMIDQERNK